MKARMLLPITRAFCRLLNPMRYSKDGSPNSWCWMISDPRARIASSKHEPEPKMAEESLLLWRVTQFLCRRLQPERFVDNEDRGYYAWLVPDKRAYCPLF